jgi:cytochrome c oxidase subunit 3/cytochrome o ubiquinol oxidase subunit 3
MSGDRASGSSSPCSSAAYSSPPPPGSGTGSSTSTGLTIGTNLFGTTYYPLVGLHASHVIIGLSMLSLCCLLAWSGALRPVHGERVELVSWYWHFVDAVWVVVFTVVYVVGR